MLYDRQYKAVPTSELFRVVAAFYEENFAYRIDQLYISLTALQDNSEKSLSPLICQRGRTRAYISLLLNVRLSLDCCCRCLALPTELHQELDRERCHAAAHIGTLTSPLSLSHRMYHEAPLFILFSSVSIFTVRLQTEK